MKTPTVYSGMRSVTLPWKATIRSAGEHRQDDDPVAEGQPVAAELELARQEAVLAQEARQAREVGERGVRGQDQQQRRGDLDQVVERRARPRPACAVIWLITVSCSVGSGTTPIWRARKLIPRKIVAKKRPIRISTSPALRASGGLKAGTPFETASVPVSATEPDAKARRMRSMPKRLRAVAPHGQSGRRRVRRAACPLTTCHSAERRAGRRSPPGRRRSGRRRASRSPGCPRRLPSHSTRDERRRRSRMRSSNSPGKIEVSAATPAAIETATVST